MEPRPSSDAAARAWLAAIVALALAVRVGCWLLFDDPLEGRLIRDPAAYDAWARALVAGEPEAAPYWGDPLYAWLLAAAYACGLGPAQVMLLQAFAGAAHVALVHALARRVTGDARAALAAAALAALYEPYAYFAAALLKNTPSALCFDAALLACLWALERRRLLPALLAGWALGVTALLRPNVLLVAPALGALALGRDRRAGLPVGAGLCAGALLGVAPATWHNVTKGGELVLVNASWGVNLWLGNNPHAPHEARHLSPPGIQSDPLVEAEEWAREAARRSGARLTIGAEQRFWARLAVDYVLEAPGAAAIRSARKVLLLWNRYEVPDNRNLLFQRERTPWPLRGPLPLVGFALLAPLAAGGLVLALRGPRRGDVLALVVVVAVYTASVVPFTVNARYRILLAGPLLPFAGLLVARAFAGWSAGWSGSGAGGRARRGVIAATLGAALVVNLPLEAPEEDLARDHYDVAVHLDASGRPAEALAECDRALALDPALQAAHLERGVALARLGREAEAAAAYLEGTRGRDDVAGLAWFNLALLHERRGDRARARAAYAEALPRLAWRPDAERRARERLEALAR